MQNNDYIEFGEESQKIILPSELTKETPTNFKNDKPKNKKIKWIIIFSILIIIYLYYNTIIYHILEVLKTNPTIYNYYLYIESEITNNTLKGLLFTSILGSLFFLVLPSEAIFIYYLSATEYLFLLIIAITIFGSLIGLTFNYFFGKLLGERAIRFLFKKNFEKYQIKIEKWGGYVLFFGNILPGPIEMLAVFYGGFKFPYKRFIYLAFMGRLVKYILLFLIYLFFWDEIIFQYNNLLDTFLIFTQIEIKEIF